MVTPCWTDLGGEHAELLAQLGLLGGAEVGVEVLDGNSIGLFVKLGHFRPFYFFSSVSNSIGQKMAPKVDQKAARNMAPVYLIATLDDEGHVPRRRNGVPHPPRRPHQLLQDLDLQRRPARLLLPLLLLIFESTLYI